MNNSKHFILLRYRPKPTTIKIFVGLMLIFIIYLYLLFTFKEVRLLESSHLPDFNLSVPVGLPGKSFPEKRFLHSVNSIESIRYADSRYTGIEIDVRFDTAKQFFDVHHDPVPSTGLSLDTLIAQTVNHRYHFYYIDFKNLNDNNKTDALNELCRIANKYKIASNIILESPNHTALTEFSKRGFYTSYYLPYINPDETSAKNIETHIKLIARNLAQSKVNAVSANHKQYELIKKYFNNYDIILWNSTDNLLALKIREYELLKDPHVKILLVEDRWRQMVLRIFGIS